MKHIIVKNNVANYTIVTSQFADCAQLYAASQLQKYINKACNTFIPYYSDKLIKRTNEILVGKKARDLFNDYDTSFLGEEGYAIKSVNNDIAIFGHTSRGTIYGVFAFLEKFLGFRCFAKNVEQINSQNDLALGNLNICDKPTFEYRETYSRNAWDIDFAVKNKLNSNLTPVPKEMGGRLKFFNCHHSFFDLVPPKYYKSSHPEYYSQSTICEGGQLCLSNPEVFKIAREQLIQWIKDNPDCNVFSVAQNDCSGYCECEQCKKANEYYGSPSGIIIEFVNRLAESLEKEYPNVLLHTFAYQWSTRAPKNIKVHKNVLVRLCNIECYRGMAFEDYAKLADGVAKESAVAFLNNIEEWSKITDRLYVWDYVVNFKNYLIPLLPINAMAKNIRTYNEKGVKGLLMQGNFSYGGDICMGELKNYLLAKLLWNPNQDEKAIVKEFIYGTYGLGAPYILEYVNLMEKAISGTDASIFDFADASWINLTLISKSRQLFDKALKAETNPEILARIEKEKLSVEYLEIVNIDDDKVRAQKADEFFEKLKKHGITEIMERIDLRTSIDCIKKGKFAKDRENFYWCYYIIK